MAQGRVATEFDPPIPISTTYSWVSEATAAALAACGVGATFVGFDVPTSSERIRSLLGWQPEQPGLIADIDHPAYVAQL